VFRFRYFNSSETIYAVQEQSRGTDEFKMEYREPVDTSRISQEQQGNGRHFNFLS
jgi:hypothetical protein